MLRADQQSVVDLIRTVGAESWSGTLMQQQESDRRTVALAESPLLLAQAFVEIGIPAFVVPRGDGASKATEFDWRGLNRWQKMSADPESLDAYEPSSALLIVTGNGIDAVDIDTRDEQILHQELVSLRDHGAKLLGAFQSPRGYHLLVGSGGNRTAASVRPKVDFRGDGGCLRIPPTRRPYYGGEQHEVLIWPDFESHGAGIDLSEYLGRPTFGIPNAIFTKSLHLEARKPTRTEKNRIPPKLTETVNGRAVTNTSASQSLFYVVAQAKRLNLRIETALYLAERFCESRGYSKFNERGGGLAAEVWSIWEKVTQ